MFLGQMGCEALNFLLKRIIKGERPPRKTPIREKLYKRISFSRSSRSRITDIASTGIKSKGYGMPSSHAQFLAFFSVYLTLFLLIRHSPHPSDTHSPTTLVQRIGIALCSGLFAAVVCASRVYLSYHTVHQVLVGGCVGTITAIAWFVVTELARRLGWVQWALDKRELSLFRIRDLVVEEDLAESGWERWKIVSRRRKSEKGQITRAKRKQR